jgi:hypothetical protein
MESVTPGEGGSYLLDPKTGKVQVLHKTEPAPTTSQSEDLNDAPEVSETSPEEQD